MCSCRACRGVGSFRLQRSGEFFFFLKEFQSFLSFYLLRTSVEGSENESKKRDKLCFLFGFGST